MDVVTWGSKYDDANHEEVIGSHRRLGPRRQPFAISPDNIQSVGRVLNHAR
jgi:hypothetical protein